MRKSKSFGDQWHLDEVFCKINGQTCYLWRAVDQDGQVLDVLVQRKRNKHAASRFFGKLKRHGHTPRSITTDKLASYRLPRKEHFPLTPHITDKWANNRAENSHQIVRIRERRMKKFKSISQAQHFLRSMSEFYDHFQMSRHKATAKVHRILLNRSLDSWRTIAQNPLIA